MGGGGKAESPPWRGPAGAQRLPHGGGYSALGTRGQSPWRSTQSQRTEAAASLSRVAAQERHPRNGATQPAAWRRAERATRPLRESAAPQTEASARPPPAGKERGESACGSAQKRRSLRVRRRRAQAVDVFSPSRSLSAPDRHPKEPGLQARSALANRAGRPQGSVPPILPRPMPRIPAHRGARRHAGCMPANPGRRFQPPTPRGSCSANRESDRSCPCPSLTFR